MGWEGKTNFYRCSLQEARTGRIGFTWEAWFNFPILLLICRYPGVFRTCVNQHMCMKIATFRERYLPFQNRCTEDIHKSSPEVLLLLEEWNRQSVQTQVSHLEMSIVRWNEAYTILVFFLFFCLPWWCLHLRCSLGLLSSFLCRGKNFESMIHLVPKSNA